MQINIHENGNVNRDNTFNNFSFYQVMPVLKMASPMGRGLDAVIVAYLFNIISGIGFLTYCIS